MSGGGRGLVWHRCTLERTRRFLGYTGKKKKLTEKQQSQRRRNEQLSVFGGAEPVSMLGGFAAEACVSSAGRAVYSSIFTAVQ